jgi:predicted transcriptional regulator with HTH domain
MSKPARDTQIEHALRRSVASVRMLIALHHLREARTNQLARAAAIPPGRVKWIYAGRMPYYRPDQSHRSLGFVTRHGHWRRPVYRITEEGDRVARLVLRERWRQGGPGGI